MFRVLDTSNIKASVSEWESRKMQPKINYSKLWSFGQYSWIVHMDWRGKPEPRKSEYRLDRCTWCEAAEYLWHNTVVDAVACWTKVGNGKFQWKYEKISKFDLNLNQKPTIWAIKSLAIRNSRKAHNKSQPTNKYGMNGRALRMRKFDAYRINGFSWYKSPEYGLTLFSYRNAPSWTGIRRNIIKHQSHRSPNRNLTSFPWV